MNKPHYFIGLMSGTSADGIEACLVKPEDKSMELVGRLSYPLPHADELQALNHSQQISLTQLSQLQRDLGEAFAQAALNLIYQHELQPADITAIGSHGHTLFHAPELGMSLQIGHPAIIAKRTGISTYGDFRVDDMALGGQGAPLAPLFHQAWLHSHNIQQAWMVNIGGMANVSLITPHQPLQGWDTGPGNSLMDEICQQYFNCAFDDQGQLAASVAPNQVWLAQLLDDPYFSQPPPKSTGRDYFNQAWLRECLPAEAWQAPQQLLSTLNALTVYTIAQAVNSINAPVIICGGGSLNRTLIQRLQDKLANQLATHTVETTQDYQTDPLAIEGMLCAWLAQQAWLGNKVDLTSVTGSEKPMILGGCWQGK
ncbi:anhydro-N-acetylmuramic acid kinase [Thiomicrospira cyclica]|uniref:Anhydro-N-acetylmuramic acid kinase n=1 Tax=Thiomicrospira cyclica (strain DSM 14477 / JCM 11371 / ALM1) TaxID=717773 RepID=F6D8V7_THICA|nr:anhydro-N-acetylmuramic acid kinase [Thiomicrospira cyclica]AEG31957.1 Anhydro-N-acetylmuramic acid kinase [Thiomicrospira cyclica ALM1]